MFHIDVNTFNIYKYSVCISCIPRHSRVKSFGDSSAKAATVCIYKLHHVICLGEGQMETDLTGKVLGEGCGKTSPVNLDLPDFQIYEDIQTCNCVQCLKTPARVKQSQKWGYRFGRL